MSKINKSNHQLYGGYRGQTLANTYNKLTIIRFLLPVCTEHYDFQVLCRQGIYSAAYLTSELCAALAMWVCGSVKLCYGAMCGWKIWFLAVFGCCNLVFGKY